MQPADRLCTPASLPSSRNRYVTWRRTLCGFRLSHGWLDILCPGLVIRRPRKRVDHFSGLATKHLLGSDLLSASYRSTAVRCRTLGRIEGRVLLGDCRSGAPRVCGHRRGSWLLERMCPPKIRRRNASAVEAPYFSRGNLDFSPARKADPRGFSPGLSRPSHEHRAFISSFIFSTQIFNSKFPDPTSCSVIVQRRRRATI